MGFDGQFNNFSDAPVTLVGFFGLHPIVREAGQLPGVRKNQLLSDAIAIRLHRFGTEVRFISIEMIHTWGLG